jgi:renalase
MVFSKRALPDIPCKWHGTRMTSDVLIVGAGIAGLSCAKVLASAGKTVRVVERSRGVGGRCATRRIDGQPVDHGSVFLHGSSPEFLSALREVPGRWCDGWPNVVRGTGTPCQPSAFVPGAHRMAHADGVSAFPKYLAAGLDVVLDTTATGFELGDDGITVRGSRQNEVVSFTASDVVLALAGPQSLALLEELPPSPGRETARAVLAMMPSVPCATVLALYPTSVPPPSWDIWYPETSTALSLVAHDSAKRDAPARLALVLQARPSWSSAVVGSAPSEWAPRLLADAASLIGSWVAQPVTWQAHMWRYARTSPECELAGPFMLDLGNGRRVGIAGELFAPGGGVQAAWQAGIALARRLLDKEQR